MLQGIIKLLNLRLRRPSPAWYDSNRLNQSGAGCSQVSSITR